MLRLDLEETLKLDEQDSVILISCLISPKFTLEKPTKSYVDSLHKSSGRRRDLSLVFNDQKTEFDNKQLTNLESVTVIRTPSSDNELAIKKIIDDKLDKNTSLDLIKLYKTISKYMSEMTHINLLSMINYN